jgi:hypothetical protein
MGVADDRGRRHHHSLLRSARAPADAGFSWRDWSSAPTLRTTGSEGITMAFVQVMTYKTEHRAEMDAALQRWLEDTQDVRRARRRLLLRDRNAEDSYMEVVFFDSYEDAMHNSRLPATTMLSQQFERLISDGFHFRDFDVADEEL